MAYPAGVTLRAIAFSDIIDAEDGTEAASTTRVIVACNDILVHVVTGKILLPTPQIFLVGFSLPVTDQAATWTSELGTALVSPTHSYRIDMEKKVGTEWIKVKSWPKVILPAGGAFDLDTYFDGLSTPYTLG